MDEMRREMDSMRGFEMFASFPTETVRANMATALIVVSSAEVDRLWEAYKKSVQGGLAPYAKGGGGAVVTPLLRAMERETGYHRASIVAFLNALEKAVHEQGWDWRWLDPRAAKEAGLALTPGESISHAAQTTGQSVGGFLKPGLDPVTNIVKYTAVALVAGAVIYGIYHGTKIWRKGKK
jgi:hypothetical protein